MDQISNSKAIPRRFAGDNHAEPMVIKLNAWQNIGSNAMILLFTEICAA
jgi:hypothetical protein